MSLEADTDRIITGRTAVVKGLRAAYAARIATGEIKPWDARLEIDRCLSILNRFPDAWVGQITENIECINEQIDVANRFGRNLSHL
jgi:hypothetical protein